MTYRNYSTISRTRSLNDGGMFYGISRAMQRYSMHNLPLNTVQRTLGSLTHSAQRPPIVDRLPNNTDQHPTFPIDPTIGPAVSCLELC